MIYVVTVHWKSPRWITPQLAYLERHVSSPYRVFAALNGIDDTDVWKRFDFAEDMDGTHPVKLNRLADIVATQADPSDTLVFLDGDAFPIQPLVPWLDEMLRVAPLVAVRRDENLGDCQPHPSFCATTVGFWKELDGDWTGGRWVNAAGREVVDAGGKLLHRLEEHEVEWLPLLRTNTYNPHPLWFGVYAHRIYHHGAGFQEARAERVDWAERHRENPITGRAIRPTPDAPSLGLLRTMVADDAGVLRRFGRRLPIVVGQATVKTLRLRREHRYFERQHRSDRARNLSELNTRVFDQLVSDPEFFRQFDEAVPDADLPHEGEVPAP